MVGRKNSEQEEGGKKYPTTKQVLLIAGVGAFIAGSFILPGLPLVLKAIKFDPESIFDDKEWEKFDESRLRQKIKELQRQKVVKLYFVNNSYIVKTTKKGRKKLLKYKVDELEIPKPDKWDKRWRIVAYDIPKEKKTAGDALRKTLKGLGFMKLQKSVYLYPYPCADMIDFIRELYGIGQHVTLLNVGYLEEEDAYKKYFDL